MLLTYTIVFLFPCVLGFPEEIPIGGLFDGDEMIQKAFELSIKAVNERIATSADIFNVTLTPISQIVDFDEFEVSTKACDILYYRVAGIFGPQNKSTANYVKSMCDIMDIPHISARSDVDEIRGSTINFYPHIDSLSTAFHQLVQAFKWKAYAIVYESVDSLVRMRLLLKFRNPREYDVGLYHLGNGPNFRNVLLDVKRSMYQNVIIDCSHDILAAVLRQSQQVGILSDEYQVLVTSLDFQSVDLEPYQYSGVNLTGVRLIDLEHPIVQEILGARSLNWNLSEPSHLRVVPALTYDAVQLFARGFARLRDSVKGNLKRLSCNSSQSWEYGYSLSNFMRSEEMRGLTGLIKFDTAGFRSDIKLDIIRPDKHGVEKIGSWTISSGVSWTAKARHTILNKERTLEDLHFTVLISMTDPYGMLKESADSTTGNDRFEGFGVDIIAEMSKILGFNYTFQVENVYGSLKKETGEWNGMIGMIMRGAADLAITDLTITEERGRAVDFTTPFMNLGISVLYRKPTKAPPSILSFLLPFHKDIWKHLIGVYIVVTLLLYFIGRLCPAEWTNPYPCIKEPEVLENPFNVQDTPFFVIGSILKSPTGFAPAGISTRAIATAWWFFCLIMYTTYTANLAAALSTKPEIWPFRSAYELAYQNKIKYGAKREGSTLAFFKNSTYPPYALMYQFMEKHADEVLPRRNDDGVAKVQHEDYAFLMESSSINYIKNRKCNVSNVGGLLDQKGYGIAMRKNVPYRSDLNGALLKLKETGIIKELEEKWWRQKKGGDTCDEKKEVKVEPLNLEDVGGIFIISISGVILGWIPTLFSWLWQVRKVAIKNKVPFKDEIMYEIKFLVRCHKVKRVRRRLPSIQVDKDM